MKRFLPLTLAVVLALFTTGCELFLIGAGVAAGAGAIAYTEGEMESLEDIDFEEARAATDEALEELDYTVEEREVSRKTIEVDAEEDQGRNDLLGAGEDVLATATYSAQDTDGDKVSIKLEKLADSQTRFNIRVGTFGDETQSRKILKTIQENF